MAKKIVIVPADEEAIFRQLDNDLFYEDIPREQFAGQPAIDALTDIDEMVTNALRRALRLQLPPRIRYNKQKETINT